MLAAAVNSPILLGKRLWHETRISVFEYSVDARSAAHQARGLKPRVHFGDHWVDESVTEIFKEDIARFRVILTTETEDDPLAMVDQGIAPKLNALCLHNGTVYRWNRPCYGISDGKAHLRIENRILPAGPSIPDEMANAAFWLGLMNGLDDYLPDIASKMEFDTARANFVAGARLGLDTNMTWIGGKKMSAANLIQEELLPIAEEGLKKADIDQSSINRYIDIISNSQ